jgi:hypothetical protein
MRKAGFTMLMPMLVLTETVTIIHNVTPTTNKFLIVGETTFTARETAANMIGEK